MDEIQHCIADAQYGEALRQIDEIKPKRKIPTPPSDWDLRAYEKELGITYEYVVKEPLGFYCFEEYLKDKKPKTVILLQFVKDVIEYRETKHIHRHDAVKLLDKYKDAITGYDEDVEDISKRTAKEAWEEGESRANIFDELDTKIRKKVAGSDFISFTKCDGTQTPADRRGSAAFMAGGPQAPVDADGDAAEGKPPIPHYLVYLQLKWYQSQPVEIRHFSMYRELGRGAFGSVAGAALNTTGVMVALKCSNRKLVKGKNAKKLIEAERKILSILGDHPSKFCVYLIYAFRDKDCFYFALPLLTGGDLSFHLNRSETHSFTVERSCFYAAEIMMGLAHMHSLGILYRDLKPENILLGDEGHAAISDMGLAVVTNGRRWKGRAGTPGYWAPEMLKKEKYSYAVDWWSFGCVLFEFLTGKCPFSTKNTKLKDRDQGTLCFDLSKHFPKTIKNIHGTMVFPDGAKDLVLKLLRRNAEKRYGAKGVSEIKHHKFFKEINFRKLSKSLCEPPWKPKKLAINAENQVDLDDKNAEHQYRKEKIMPEDDIPEFDYICGDVHQDDIVQVMKEYRRGNLDYLGKQNNSGCCTIL